MRRTIGVMGACDGDLCMVKWALTRDTIVLAMSIRPIVSVLEASQTSSRGGIDGSCRVTVWVIQNGSKRGMISP